MPLRFLLCGMPALLGGALTATPSGHARAELLVPAAGYIPGEEVVVAFKLTVDEGWHTYWENPGDTGMPLGVEWELPQGVQAGSVLYPVPVSFATAGLPGFGYLNEAIFPVPLRLPMEARGELRLAASLRWLCCDASTCVAGKARVEATLRPRSRKPPEQDAAGQVIRSALEQVPREWPGAILDLQPVGKGGVKLTVTPPPGTELDGARWLPATPHRLDLHEPLRPEPVGGKWIAIAKLHEFAPARMDELKLVLAGGRLPHPVFLLWRPTQGK